MQTGRIQQPAPIPISNLMLVCPRCDRPTRVKRGRVEDKRVRICRRCHEREIEEEDMVTYRVPKEWPAYLLTGTDDF